jgi:hypothetical protein
MRADAKIFSPGFRFSKQDGIILFLGGWVGMDLAAVMFWPGVAVCLVIAHFFVFCNIVRMKRAFELAWAGIFICLMASTNFLGAPSWPVSLLFSLLAAAILVGLELWKPSYHGAFWRVINPDLPQWWAEHV